MTYLYKSDSNDDGKITFVGLYAACTAVYDRNIPLLLTQTEEMKLGNDNLRWTNILTVSCTPFLWVLGGYRFSELR